MNTRPSVARVFAVLALVAVAAMGVACSSDSTPTVSPADATDRVVQQWGFSDDARPCLEAAFARDAGARRALAADADLTDVAVEALAAVVTGCVDGPAFAAAVAPQMIAGYTGVGTAIDAAQEQCVKAALAALPDEDRGLIITGPISQMHDPTAPRSIAVGDVLHRVLDGCGVVVGPSDTTPSTAA